MMETKEPKRGEGFEERYGGPSRLKAAGLWGVCRTGGRADRGQGDNQ